MKLFLLLLLVLSWPALAGTPDSLRHVDSKTPVVVVSASYTSVAGESLDAFALRIAPDLLDHSQTLGSELCGEFKLVEGTYTIAFYTLNLETACSYQRVGKTGYTGLSMHSHINLKNHRFSEEDYAHPGYLASGKWVLFQQGEGTSRRLQPGA